FPLTFATSLPTLSLHDALPIYDAAFEAIYRRYRLPIYANILRVVHDEAAADDLLQEVFLRIWENRGRIDPDKPFGGYLFTCSRLDRKSTRLNSSHVKISYAVFC